KCAPDCLPHGEKMRAIAVPAMASPVRARRKKGSGNRVRTGEPGCCRSTVKTQAEIMKIPSSAASMAYSGQCLAKVAAASGNGEPCGGAVRSEIRGEVISSMLVTGMGYERTQEVTENFSGRRRVRGEGGRARGRAGSAGSQCATRPERSFRAALAS